MLMFRLLLNRSRLNLTVWFGNGSDLNRCIMFRKQIFNTILSTRQNPLFSMGVNCLWSPVTSATCTGRHCINLVRPGFNDLYGGGVTGTTPNAADPTRVAAGLLFDGVDDLMTGVDATLTTLSVADAASVFCIHTLESVSGGCNSPYITNGAARLQPAISNAAFTLSARTVGTDSNNTTNILTTNNVGVCVMWGGVVNYTAQTLLAYRNGATNTTYTGTLTAGPTAAGLATIRTHFGGSPLKGTLYAIGLFKRALTLAEFAQIAAYYRGQLAQFGVVLP